MYSDALNPFGIRNGRLVTINDVPSGLACGCLCPSCGAPLVARKGPKKVHHFSHSIKTDCKGALETALHIKAKQIFDRNTFIVLPDPCFEFLRSSYDSSFKIWDLDKKLFYTSAIIESKIGNLRPDVVLSLEKGPPFLVEIYVTHPVNSEKTEIIKDLKLPCIEIDLRYLKRLDLLDDKLIENAVIHCCHTKRWINRPFSTLAEESSQRLQPYKFQKRLGGEFYGMSQRAQERFGR